MLYNPRECNPRECYPGECYIILENVILENVIRASLFDHVVGVTSFVFLQYLTVVTET